MNLVHCHASSYASMKTYRYVLFLLAPPIRAKEGKELLLARNVCMRYSKRMLRKQAMGDRRYIYIYIKRERRERERERESRKENLLMLLSDQHPSLYDQSAAHVQLLWHTRNML